MRITVADDLLSKTKGDAVFNKLLLCKRIGSQVCVYRQRRRTSNMGVSFLVFMVLFLCWFDVLDDTSSKEADLLVMTMSNMSHLFDIVLWSCGGSIRKNTIITLKFAPVACTQS